MSDSKNIKRYHELSTELDNISLKNISLREKLLTTARSFEHICEMITAEESIQFPSFFSQIVFLCQKYHVPYPLEKQLQTLRRKYRFTQKSPQHSLYQKEYDRFCACIKDFYKIVFLQKYPNSRLLSDKDATQKASCTTAEYVRLQVLNHVAEQHLLICTPDIENPQIWHVRYNMEGINELFTPSIRHLQNGAQINIIHPHIEEADGKIVVTPEAFVIEPDYLIDVSSLAECATSLGTNPLLYLRRKFETSPNNEHILLGNIANFFLDQLIHSSGTHNQFEETFKETFKLMPVEFATCHSLIPTEAFRLFMNKAHMQYSNILRVIRQDFPTLSINPSSCVLEPTFYCEKYGIQGRLDLLHASTHTDGNTHLHIIELKSGKLPFPGTDNKKISANHEAQTFLYRMLIGTAYKANNRNIMAAILYSSSNQPQSNLRYTPTLKQREYELLESRNRIIRLEQLLASGVQGAQKAISLYTNINNHPTPPLFLQKQIADFANTLNQLSSIEQAYFYHFISFISKELYLHKVGAPGIEGKRSASRLWQSSFLERREAKELFDNLHIASIDENQHGMFITFSLGAQTQQCTNFREGDLCAVYPQIDEEHAILFTQVLKGTIIRITGNSVDVRFRHKQRNHEFFRRHPFWVIEHDYIDHQYSSMLQNMFSFIQSKNSRRNLILGIHPPAGIPSHQPTRHQELSMAKQKANILNKAIASQDYFLLVGPPGTGKTSIYAQSLIKHYFCNENCNILVIAYTNKAVDELCQAIENATNSTLSYIRIGSEYSCAGMYRKRLLQHIASECTSRRALVHQMQQTRIYVGTLAALQGKPELFDLKTFQIAIIDEASQILEPGIINILTKVSKFILIGDHKQLATITLQPSTHSVISDQHLNNIGFKNCRESLFERMYRRCKEQNWNHCFDQLSYQGRMHTDIAAFINKNFYHSQLKTIHEWQNAPLNLHTDSADKLKKLITQKRVVFISTDSGGSPSFSKSNQKEAETATKVVAAFYDIYQENQQEIDHSKIGIITPYRNQIALIKQQLSAFPISQADNIMVDTVERYQGSQRDIIIISFCINHPIQLDFLANLNEEKSVDRKLNVAMSRARKHLILIGNEQILRKSPLYNQLLNQVDKFTYNN